MPPIERFCRSSRTLTCVCQPLVVVNSNMGNSLSSANVSVEEVQRKLKISLLARHKLFLEDADQAHRSLRDLLDSHRPKAISEDGLSKNEILSWAKELSLLNLNESALENLFQITNTTSPTFDELCALLGLAKGSDRKIPLKLKMWLRARRTRNGKKKCKAIDDLHSPFGNGRREGNRMGKEASRCAGHVQTFSEFYGQIAILMIRFRNQIWDMLPRANGRGHGCIRKIQRWSSNAPAR